MALDNYSQLLADERANSGAFAQVSLLFSGIVCASVGLLITTESTVLLEAAGGVGFLAVGAWMLLISVRPEYDEVNRGGTP